MTARPDDYVAVVRANADRMTAYLLAVSEPCRTLAVRDAQATKGRRFEVIDEPLATLAESWTMAIVLCPGDTTEAVARFARRLPFDQRRRIRFYHHGRLDEAAAFEPWTRQGLAAPLLVEVESWRMLHRLYGSFVNDWLYDDWKPRR